MHRYPPTKIHAIFTFILLLLSYTGLCFVSTVSSSISGDITVSVNPHLYRASHLGETFIISIDIGGVTSSSQLTGAEFKLRYDTTVIETRESLVEEGDFFAAFGDTYFQAYFETDGQGAPFIHAFVVLLPSQNGNYNTFPQGAGALATVTFTAIQRTQTTISSELTLFDVMLVDSDLTASAPQTTNGLFEIALLAPPILEVVPSRSVALRIGESFSINVNVRDLDQDWDLVGLQVRMRYNTSLLETKPEWIVEGDFLKNFGTTFFTRAVVEADYALAGIIILPNQLGSWTGPFPQGTGTITTLTFKTLYQPVLPLGSIVDTLELSETILVDNKTEGIPHTVVNGEFEIVSAASELDQYRPVDVEVDVGTIHFIGEIADFHILVTDFGKTVDADNLTTDLYYDGTHYLALTSTIEHVTEGLYRVRYTIPAIAQPGTYVLLVRVNYATVSGSAIKSFLVSPTLNTWNAYISNINDTIATVLVPSIGQIRTDLTELNASLLRVNDRVVTVTTTLGNLTTDVANLKATLDRVDGEVATVQTTLGTLQGKIESIQGDTATVKTDIGTIKAKVSDLPASTQTSTSLLYATMILALASAIAAILVLANSRKKQS